VIVKSGDLAEILAKAQIDPTLYSLNGDRHEALCVLAEGQTWKVFLSERGQRYEELDFASEDDACTHFLKRIFELAR
jgi:hypothetical protein